MYVGTENLGPPNGPPLRNLPHSYSSIVYLIMTKNFCIQALQNPSWSGIHLFFFFFVDRVLTNFFFWGRGLSIISASHDDLHYIWHRIVLSVA